MLGLARRLSAAPIATVVLLAAGCGSSAKDEGRALARKSIVSNPRAVKAFLVTDADIARQGRDGLLRSFLEFWSDLQHQSGISAAEYFDPGMRAYVGDDRLLSAFANQAEAYRSSRPGSLSVRRTPGGESVVRYTVRDARGELTPASMTWRREGRAWRIVYDPWLDSGLALAEQFRVQTAIDPTAPRPGKEALRAGARASRLQARYLGRRHDAARRRRSDTARTAAARSQSRRRTNRSS